MVCVDDNSTTGVSVRGISINVGVLVKVTEGTVAVALGAGVRVFVAVGAGVNVGAELSTEQEDIKIQQIRRMNMFFILIV